MSFFRNNDNNNVNTRFRRFHKPKASPQKKTGNLSRVPVSIINP